MKISRINLSKCPKCKLGLIFEEIDAHQCLKIQDYWVIDGIIWLGDGIRYYPLTNRKLTREKSTDKLPEPQNNILIRYWYRTLR